MTRKQIILAMVLFVLAEIILIAYVDKPLALYMQSIAGSHPEWVRPFRIFTEFGKAKWYLWPSGIGFLLCAAIIRIRSLSKEMRGKLRRVGEKLFLFFAAVALSGIAIDIVKWLIGRARPILLLRDGVYGFHPFMHGYEWRSLPSGHTATAFAIAAFLASFNPRWHAAGFAFGMGMAVSRVVVNMHFLSDTIAGALLGYVFAAMILARLNHDGIDHWKESIFPIDRKPRDF